MRYFSTSLFLLCILVVIVCGIYPFALWCIGQTLFPFQANGSMLMNVDGKIIGSKLIAQPFTKDEYFQPRPSACSYDASASASSALAASNPALHDRVVKTLDPIISKWNQAHPTIKLPDVPGDLVTTSASGLDPHISFANALFQLDRVAAAWAKKLNKDTNTVAAEIKQILQSHAEAPFGGIIGEKFINVLELNLELKKKYG